MKLYNAMEESYLKENLIHKWVTNIVRQNDGYEFCLMMKYIYQFINMH